MIQFHHKGPIIITTKENGMKQIWKYEKYLYSNAFIVLLLFISC